MEPLSDHKFDMPKMYDDKCVHKRKGEKKFSLVLKYV